MMNRMFVTTMLVALIVLPQAEAQSDDPVADGRKRSEWIERLNDKDAKARAEAASQLGEMRWFAGPGSSALAAILSGDSDSMVRQQAADALGNIPDARVAVPALIAALKDSEVAVRTLAAKALGEHGAKAGDAIPVLTNRLKDKNEFDAAAAAIGLTRIDPTRDDGIRVLIALARDSKDVDSRSYALAGLTIELDKPELLKRHAALVVPALAALMKDDGGPDEDQGWNRRMTAAAGLAALGPAAKDARPALTNALADRSKFVRLEAVRGLLRIDPADVKAMKTLVDELKALDPAHPDRFNVMDAVMLAGQLGPTAKAAVPELIALLKPDEKIHLQVQEMARHSLGQIGPAAKAALPHLTPDLKAEDRTHRCKVATAVIQIDPTNEAAIKFLKEVALDPKPSDWIDMRMDALFTLSTIPTEREAAFRTATAALRAPNEFEKRDDLRIGGQVVITRENLLLAVQFFCVRILHACGPDAKEAIRTLLVALKDPHVGVRVEAVRALQKLDPEALRATTGIK